MADENLEDGSSDSSGIGARVDKLESGQLELGEKIDRILGIVGGSSSKPDSSSEPAPPANVADEIRQQLDERDRKAASAAEDAAKTDRLAALEVKVTELAEKPPESMPRRIEKIMGWR